MRVRAANDPTFFDMSDGPFTLTDQDDAFEENDTMETAVVVAPGGASLSARRQIRGGINPASARALSWFRKPILADNWAAWVSGKPPPI